jgi:hypothetical protein
VTPFVLGKEVMSITPEVNDVDISKLFEWRTEITVTASDGEEIKAFMRLVGDAELNRARVSGMRASAELRKKLKDKNSDERLAFIPILDTTEKENVIELLLILYMSMYREEVEKTIETPFPKEPASDAELEEKEKYQAEVDEYPVKRLEIIKKEINKRVNRERKLFLKKPLNELMDEYEKLVIDQMCQAEMNNTFIEYSIYFGTFKDEDFKNRLFNSYDEFKNLPTYAKEQFIDRYINLQLGITDLKK